MLGSLYSSTTFAYGERYYPYKTETIVSFVNSCKMQTRDKELEPGEIFQVCSCICDRIRIEWSEKQYFEHFVGPWWDRKKNIQEKLNEYAKICLILSQILEDEK